MKFNKKLMAGAMASLMLVSSFAVAAPNKRNLVASYGVVLRVNGSNFTVSDDSMRPFITSDGRTYVSIAALNQMGIATAAYDKASKTVDVRSSGGGSNAAAGSVAQLQAQIQSQTSEISRLQYENTQLKNELEKLKSTKAEEEKKKNATKSLSDLSSSDRRALEKDLEKELRFLRAETRFSRNQRFDGQINISSRSVDLSLYLYDKLTEQEINDWNDRVANRRDREQLEEGYADFVYGPVRDMLKAALKDYEGYNINVLIYPDSTMKKTIVEADYNPQRNRQTASVSPIATR